MKPETEIRNLKRDIKRWYAERETLRTERESYRIRATKAEQEVAEWKRRFDALLAHTPPEPSK